MVVTISSQRKRIEHIVNEKRIAKDYEVLVSPEFEYDGETYRVVLDGHHSYEAAIADGVEPEFITGDARDHDAIGLIAKGEIEWFLETTQMEDEYYDVATGRDIW